MRGADHRGQVAAEVARVAHVGRNHLKEVSAHLAAVVEPQWRDAQPFLPDVGRRSIIGAVGGATDIALMRAVDRPKARPVTIEHRHKGGQIR
jgi:hypothetical protein